MRDYIKRFQLIGEAQKERLTLQWRKGNKSHLVSLIFSPICFVEKCIFDNAIILADPVFTLSLLSLRYSTFSLCTLKFRLSLRDLSLSVCLCFSLSVSYTFCLSLSFFFSLLPSLCLSLCTLGQAAQASGIDSEGVMCTHSHPDTHN